MARLDSVTEEPYKTPYYANIIKALDDGNEGLDAELLGKVVLDDFWKGFQAYLDKLSWREVRLCVSWKRCGLMSFADRDEGALFLSLDECASYIRFVNACSSASLHGCVGRVWRLSWSRKKCGAVCC